MATSMIAVPAWAQSARPAAAGVSVAAEVLDVPPAHVELAPGADADERRALELRDASSAELEGFVGGEPVVIVSASALALALIIVLLILLLD